MLSTDLVHAAKPVMLVQLENAVSGREQAKKQQKCILNETLHICMRMYVCIYLHLLVKVKNVICKR